MAILTVGKGKMYDTQSLAIADASDGDTIEVYYVEYFGVPGVYRETVTVTNTKTLTVTYVDRVLTHNVEANAYNFVSNPATGKTHTLNRFNCRNEITDGSSLNGSSAGTLTLNQCSIISSSTNGLRIWMGAGGTCNVNSGYFRGTRGISVTSNQATATVNMDNNTMIGMGKTAGISAFTISNTAGSVVLNNNFAYSIGTADYYSYNGTFTGSGNRSTDGTMSTTDIGAITDASFVNWQDGDIHIGTGSGLDGVGTNVGSVTDIDGNVVDTSVNPFAGCSSIASAPSAPSNASYYSDDTTDDYFVTCSPPASGLLKLRCRVTISGTLYYVRIKPTQNGWEYGLTTDSTVLLPYVNQGRISFNSVTAPSKIEVAWANSNCVLSGYTEADSVSTDYASGNDLRSGVTQNFGAIVGNFTSPSEGGVIDGLQYGASGVEYSGVLSIPTEDNVRLSSQYGASGVEYTGNVALPSSVDVKRDVGYGASGVEYSGVFYFPVESDVLSVVGYGASGVEYTGNIILPDTENVKKDIEYGASGVEYSGVFYFPDEGDVRSIVGYGASGVEFTGNLISPSSVDVTLGSNYGASGVEYSGIFHIPTESNVRLSSQYGASGVEYTGNIVLPEIGDVKQDIAYGASGVEYTGTFAGGASGVPIFSGISEFTTNSTGLRVSWLAASGDCTGYNVHVKPDGNFTSEELDDNDYLVTTVPFGLLQYTIVQDYEAEWFRKKDYYCAVRAVNGTNADDNTIAIGAVEAPGGNFATAEIVDALDRIEEKLDPGGTGTPPEQPIVYDVGVSPPQPIIT